MSLSFFQKSENTDLISLYIPPQRSLDAVVGQLIDEDRTAASIKSEQVRNNVQSGLNKIILFLRGLRDIPYQGIAIFSNGKQLVSFVPNETISYNLYRCDNIFHLDGLN